MSQTHEPPLPALRIFECAARHVSFKKAAAELHLTASAVSHSVATLEEWLGLKLFHRRVRKLLLTDAGRAYYGKLKPALDAIGEASREVSARGRSDLLTLASAPAFARAWLLPRLKSFLNEHPDVDVRIRATSDFSEMFADDVDAMIVYDREVSPDLAAVRLMTEEMVPVCSPNLSFSCDQISDLLKQRLIHTETKIVTWPMWLKAAGWTSMRDDRGLRFNRADLALEAAKAGLGIALESRILAEPYLRDGTLMIPYPGITIGNEGTYFFACRPAKSHLPKVDQFRTWIVRQCLP